MVDGLGVNLRGKPSPSGLGSGTECQCRLLTPAYWRQWGDLWVRPQGTRTCLQPGRKRPCAELGPVSAEAAGAEQVLNSSHTLCSSELEIRANERTYTRKKEIKPNQVSKQRNKNVHSERRKGWLAKTEGKLIKRKKNKTAFI